jgi:hypothetical protein
MKTLAVGSFVVVGLAVALAAGCSASSPAIPATPTSIGWG